MSDNSSTLGLTNPAGLVNLNGLSIDLSTNILRSKERRSIPVQDFFGDYLVDANYVTNGDFFNYNRIGITFSTFYIQPISFAFSQGDFLTTDYSYNEEVRDRGSSFYRDPLVGYHIFETNGTLQLQTYAVATSFFDRFSIGFSQNILLPTELTVKRDTVILENSDYIASDAVYSLSTETQQTYFSVLSTEINISKQLIFAMGYESEALVSFKDSLIVSNNDAFGLPQYDLIDSNLNQEIIKPEKVKLGLIFSPKQKINASFVLEYEKAKYSTIVIDSLTLSNTETYKIGFEYNVNNKLPVRAGLVFKPSPYRNDLIETIFTMGVGQSFANINYDLSGEYGSLSYSYFDIFQPDGDPSNPLGIEKVMESHFNIVLSVKYQF